MIRFVFWAFALGFFGLVSLLVLGAIASSPPSANQTPVVAIPPAVTPPAPPAPDLAIQAKKDLEAQYAKMDAEKEAARPQMNAANYARVQMGMTYDEVIAIVGQPSEEMSRSDVGGITTVMYMWKGGIVANANMMFQDGKVISKAQFGL